jgi:hypothetical protein
VQWCLTTVRNHVALRRTRGTHVLRRECQCVGREMGARWRRFSHRHCSARLRRSAERIYGRQDDRRYSLWVRARRILRQCQGASFWIERAVVDVGIRRTTQSRCGYGHVLYDCHRQLIDVATECARRNLDRISVWRSGRRKRVSSNVAYDQRVRSSDCRRDSERLEVRAQAGVTCVMCPNASRGIGG